MLYRMQPGMYVVKWPKGSAEGAVQYNTAPHRGRSPRVRWDGGTADDINRIM